MTVEANIMNRAIKFKLKNGKIVTIRRIRSIDYDANMKYLDKFSRDAGAIWTNQYPGRYTKKKPSNIGDDPNTLLVGVWDGDNIVGTAMIAKIRPNHPYHKGTSAGLGVGMLHKYTHNGLGTKLLQILEKWARENGVLTLRAEIRHLNIPSIANVLKAGFLITGINHNVVKINNKWMHEYIIEKNLTD